MKITSTRDTRFDDIRQESGTAGVAGFFADTVKDRPADTPAPPAPTGAVAHSIWKHQRKALRRSSSAKQQRLEYRRKRAEKEKRVSRWVAIVYVIIALATPILLYEGPAVLSPAVPAIADKALDGQFAVHPQPARP